MLRLSALAAAAAAVVVASLSLVAVAAEPRQCRESFPVDEIGMRLLDGAAASRDTPWTIDFIDIRSSHMTPAEASRGALADCNCSLSVMSQVRERARIK